MKATSDHHDQIKKYEETVDKINASFDPNTPEGLQRKSLNKNYQIRQIQETIAWAASNGFTSITYPTAETVAVIQGYTANNGLTQGLEKVLENPWTHVNAASFDTEIHRLFTSNGGADLTGTVPAKIATSYGPFVVIPKDIKTVFQLGNASRGPSRLGNEAKEPGIHVEMGYKLPETLPENETWRGLNFKTGEGTWIGSNNVLPNGMVDYSKATHLQVRSRDYKVAGEFDGTAAGGLNRTSKWHTQNNNLKLPKETRDNLQAGLYHIDENGKWNFVDDGKDKEKIKEVTRTIRQKHHKVLSDNTDFNPLNYHKDHQPILRKYHEELPQNLDFILGKDNWELTHDRFGNAKYRLIIPGEYPIKEGQINAFSKGGEINQRAKGLKQFQEGGGIDYSGAQEVQLNGNSYYKHKVTDKDNKGTLSEKYGLWNSQGVLNSVNNKFPDYAKQVNRFWPGDEILVGGPEFELHNKYTKERREYANSFKALSDEQMLSTITAIGHVETGNLVKYTKPEDRVYKTGEDIDEFGNAIEGGLYDYDNKPWTGTYESGLDNAYKFVSDYNALGRFGIKETHLDKYAKEVLKYKDGKDWKSDYLNSKEDQQILMKHLITDVYPNELVGIRHSYPEATAQYSDFELLSALHKEGNPRLRKQLEKGSFSESAVKDDISVGGYVNKISRYLNPDLDNNIPFHQKGQPLHETFKNIPVYKFGGSIGKLEGNVKDEVISDMLENGAFLPKFKRGAEKSIDGILGKYKINKGYDENANLPFIEYRSSTEELKDNKIYYDKDDNGNDNFNIIDLYKQKFEQDRAHSRIKDIIKKYKKGESLSFTERNEMEVLGLLENKPKKEIAKKEIPEMKYGGASLPLDKINTSKDLFNKTDANNYGISLASQIALYDAQVNGIFDKDIKFNKIKSIYNRLNTLYYNDAKSSKLTVLDYMKSLNN
tara:strand:- start:22 stop:2832 length:2811 start_codon:yes stop_codon:yes gene_type:complete